MVNKALEHYSERVRSAIRARETSGDDFFGGWLPEDAELFRKYRYFTEAADGMIVDFLGMRTAAQFHPWAHHLAGTVGHDVPIPDDGIKAEAIEYFALLQSLDFASSERFTVCELGASYAPWACAATVLARRTGRAYVKAIAVEASSFMFGLIPQHFANNGILAGDAELRFLRGAVSHTEGDLFFPIVSHAGENGGRAVGERSSIDYVGRAVEYETVRTFRLGEIIGSDHVDLLHIDIQGAEADVLSGAIDLINAQVRTLFVGTHSRLIEGQLMQLLHDSGWRLLRERPTKVAYEAARAEVLGWTTRDGGQVWINSRFVAPGS